MNGPDAPAPQAAFADAHRLLFEKSPQPMWVLDRHTLAFLDVNEAALAHYGYARAEFLALTALDIRPPEERDRFLEHVRGGEAAPRPWPGGVWRHRKRDGTVIDVEVFSNALRYRGREAVLVVASDVTARRLAEEARVRRERQAALRADVSDAL